MNANDLLDKEGILRGSFVPVYEQDLIVRAVEEIIQIMQVTIQFKELEIRLETRILENLTITFDKRRL